MTVKAVLERFFAERDPEPFAILRIGIGIAAFVEFLGFGPHLAFYFSGSGFLPQSALPLLGPGSGPTYLLAISESVGWVTACFVLLLLSALAYAAGQRTKVSGPLLLLLLLSFINRNVYSMTGASILIVQMLLVMLWADVGQSLRFAPGRSTTRGSVGVPSWIGALIALQMNVLYFKSGFYKAMGKPWVDGDAIKFMLANPDWRRFDFDAWLSNGAVLKVCEAATQVTLFWELSFPLLFLHRRTRNLALAVGTLLHVGQFFTVETASFSILLLSVYPCLLHKDDYQRLRQFCNSGVATLVKH